MRNDIIEAPSTQNRIARTRYYMGGYWTFLATGKDTNGQFSLIEMNLRKGVEPPAHTHTNEDESFYVVDGELVVTTDQQEHRLTAGDFIHLAKGVTHGFKLLSDKVKLVCHLMPAGLEEMFLELSPPADTLDYPPMPAGPPSQEWLQKVGALQKRYGIVGLDNTKIKVS